MQLPLRNSRNPLSLTTIFPMQNTLKRAQRYGRVAAVVLRAAIGRAGDANTNEFRWRNHMPKLLPAPTGYTDMVPQCGYWAWDCLRESAVETLDRD